MKIIIGDGDNDYKKNGQRGGGKEERKKYLDLVKLV
jgi:hypothetical protein